ncbi:hypothetical protein Tco_1056191 [Tanacetum coccineum]|uniref:Uncharacterized protein n=1 Tax=Tanacetum coccineum TaxID=301880 RepID=A0ABQ5H214_9ASTR
MGLLYREGVLAFDLTAYPDSDHKQDCTAMSLAEAEYVALSASSLPEERFQYLVRRIGMRCLTPAELEVKIVSKLFQDDAQYEHVVSRHKDRKVGQRYQDKQDKKIKDLRDINTKSKDNEKRLQDQISQKA